MIHEVEAVYEHGVLRPLRPLSLAERQQVRLTISDAPARANERDTALVERARLEVAALGTVGCKRRQGSVQIATQPRF
jgi:predicted DNA-binding antitoxin AbrB/MazE fold protein